MNGLHALIIAALVMALAAILHMSGGKKRK
jgi:hypothetical protein